MGHISANLNHTTGRCSGPFQAAQLRRLMWRNPLQGSPTSSQPSLHNPHARPAPAGVLCSAAVENEAVPPSAAGWTQHSWVWRGHRINYVAAGCGRPMLLVHGFGASAGHWRRTIPALVDKGYKVYAVDLLGFGASDQPALQYSMELWDEQLRAFMAEFMDQPAVVVGNSVGSLACLMVAAAAPERVAGVVLLNCAGGMNNKAVGSAEDWRIQLAMPIFNLIDFLLSKPKVARFLFDKFRTKETIRKVLLNVYPSNASAVDDELVDLLFQPSCNEGALEVFVSVLTGPPGPRPEGLVRHSGTAPMLVLWGDTDSFTPSDGPVGKYFQSLPPRRPKTTFVHLPGVGHCPMDEAPETVNQHLMPWLEKHHI